MERISYADSVKRRARIVELLKENPQRLRQEIADQVQAELGVPCRANNVSTIAMRSGLGKTGGAKSKAKTTPRASVELVGKKSSFEADVEAVHAHLQTLGISELVIKLDGSVAIVRIQRETFHVR